MFAPENAAVPVPILVIERLPPSEFCSTPEKLLLRSSVPSVRVAVSAETVPPPDSAPIVCELEPRKNSPALMNTMTESARSALAPSVSFPALRLIWPVNVLTPSRICSPVPSFPKPPVPDIVPEKVLTRPLATVTVKALAPLSTVPLPESPPITSVLLSCRLAPEATVTLLELPIALPPATISLPVSISVAPE